MYKFKLGVVGYGNMAGAILNGILKSKIIDKNSILVCDVDNEKLNSLDNEISKTNSNQEVFDNCEYILIAVKPQIFNSLLTTEKYTTNASAIISIMAGKNIKTIKNKFISKPTVVRIMPNTPCLVASGMSGLVFDDTKDNKLIDFVTKVFDSIGKTIVINESQIDNVSSISGSGPAYSYMFVNALIKAGINIGLTFDEAKLLTIQTLNGSCKMLKDVQSIKDIDELTDRVCSKGGSTIEAVNYLRENNFDNIISDAIKKCKQRNIELSKI